MDKKKKYGTASNKEKMIAGKLYTSLDTELIIAKTKTRMRADRFNKTHAWNVVRRTLLLKKIFPNAKGKNAYFEPTIRVEYGFNTTYGDNFFMNFDCQLLDVSPITIGDNVMFGPRVVLATPCHPLVADERIAQKYPNGFYNIEYSKPITVGDNVWISANVTVCGGVTIGNNTVIAAGSVVTRDIPSGVLAGGVPCKVIREITENDRMFPWETYIKE